MYCLQIQYAKTGLDGVKDMAEEKYELVHTKVVDTWGQITVETGEGIEELPEVSTLTFLHFGYTPLEGSKYLSHWQIWFTTLV